MHSGILILDFGSQFTQLIARRLREFNVFTEILAFDVPIEEIKKRSPKGIILSGGPSSVQDKDSPARDIKELAQLAPILGICYGMQLITHQLGGLVMASEHREYGLKNIEWKKIYYDQQIQNHTVWMSHGEVVKVPPPGFHIGALSESGLIAAIHSPRIWGVQFHPEVTHTQYGMDFLRAFCFKLCGVQADWDTPHIEKYLIQDIQAKVQPHEHVLLGLSGGVDSSVVAMLLTKALGAERVHCVFVNNGLLRKNEYQEVLNSYREIGLNVVGVNAEKSFLKALEGISDPEQKRKTIGHVFIEVFQKAAEKMGVETQYLAQGTLYPDVIESISLRGSSVTIKSHHNVGGLPEKMSLKLIEPLRELFKDEVRLLGKVLGLPDDILMRHPFPGPGLAIRCIGEITKEDLETLRECDDIYIKALKEFGIYQKIWQAFSVLLPIRSVGVQGDGRSYEKVLALRAVTSTDGMTADWFDFDPQFLREVSNRITNQVKAVNRVVYDITSKPPGTIEWE